VLASAKSPYSDTRAAIAGKTARSAKNATPPSLFDEQPNDCKRANAVNPPRAQP
jgi:hypothetical protein